MAEKELWRAAMNAWDEASPQKEGIQAEWQRVVDAISKELREDEVVAVCNHAYPGGVAWRVVNKAPLRDGDKLFTHPAPKVPAGWQPMESAPKDQLILVAFDGHTRLARYGKASHMPMYGFCIADQGVEDFDLCKPTHWMPLPEAPKGENGMITIEAYEHKPPSEYEWRLLFPSLATNVKEAEHLRTENAALRARCEEQEKKIAILELKNKGTLANNLCPDCRDKQVGKPCLACTIQSQEKVIGIAWEALAKVAAIDWPSAATNCCAYSAAITACSALAAMKEKT